MSSNEERCLILHPTTGKCMEYSMSTKDKYWQCKKYTAESIREYAAQELRNITQDNQI